MSQLSVVLRRNGLLGSFLRQNIRTFCAPAQQPSQKPPVDANINKGTHRASDFEKKLLVWTGKYKNVEEIPGYVSQEAVERARNKFRIRTANIMMLLTLVGCVVMVVSGKRAAEKGESVLKMNQEWHKEYNEQAQAEALAKAQNPKK